MAIARRAADEPPRETRPAAAPTPVAPPGRTPHVPRFAWLLLGLAAAAGAALWLASRGGCVGDEPRLRTARVVRGTLDVTVGATGTVEPEEVVDVGAQVAGMIRELGRDPADDAKRIDYGSAVEQGTVLARIDDTLYRAQID